MIKIKLKRRKESDTYLATDRRHHRRTQIAMKVDNCVAFSWHCGLHQLKRKTDLGVSMCRWGETGSKGGGGPVRLLDVGYLGIGGILKLVDTLFHVGGGHGRGWYLGLL